MESYVRIVFFIISKLVLVIEMILASNNNDQIMSRVVRYCFVVYRKPLKIEDDSRQGVEEKTTWGEV